MKNNFLSIAIICCSFLTGCATEPEKPPMTPLQIQAMQTQSFKSSKRKVFNSTMQVFQDLGYTIESANFDTGFISAQSMSHQADDGSSDLEKIAKLFHALDFKDKNEEHQMTTGFNKVIAFIYKPPNHNVKIRISIVGVANTSINGGSPNERDQQILDPVAYNKIFSKIKQSLFVGDAIS